MVAKTPDFLELAGSVAVPVGKRGTAWDEVIRRTRAERVQSRTDRVPRHHPTAARIQPCFAGQTCHHGRYVQRIAAAQQNPRLLRFHPVAQMYMPLSGLPNRAPQ